MPHILADLYNMRIAQCLARILIARRPRAHNDQDLLASIIAAIRHAAHRYHKRDWREIPLFSTISPRFPCEQAGIYNTKTMWACTMYAVGYHNINISCPGAICGTIHAEWDQCDTCEYHDEYLCGMINAARDDSARYYLHNFETAIIAHRDDDIFSRYIHVLRRTAKRCIRGDQLSSDPFHKLMMSLALTPANMCNYYYVCVQGLIMRNCATLLRDLLQMIPDNVYAIIRKPMRDEIIRHGSVTALRAVLISDGAPTPRGFTDEEIIHAYEYIFRTSRVYIRTIRYACARWGATYARLLEAARHYCGQMILYMGELHAELVSFCLADSVLMAEIRALDKISMGITETVARRHYTPVVNSRVKEKINGLWHMLFPDSEPILRAME